MHRLYEMLRLQQELNDRTNGEGWERGVTRQNKPIDWRRCIWLEAAELVESYPWKHWKSIDAEPDYENIRIEAVDIWHFVMSEAIRMHRLFTNGDLHALAERLASTESFASFAEASGEAPRDIYAQIRRVEEFLAALFSDESIEDLTARFFDVALQSGLDLDRLYRLYVGKNILNRFRQDHGYKEGIYRKEWDGKEDNVVMQEIMERNPQITPAELYNELERFYEGL